MTNFYRVTDNVDNMSASDVDQLVDALSGTNDVGQIQLYAPISTPSALTAAVNTQTGNLNGAYKYAVAFITGYWKGATGIGTLNVQGNTGGGAQSNTVNPTNQQSNLSAIPVGPAGVVARAIYRTKAGGSTFYLLTQINDNTTTTWTDNTADSSLTQVMPSTNTTGTYMSVNTPTQSSHAVSKQYADSVAAGTTAPATTVSLSNGLQILNTTRSGILQNFNAQGRTLSNMAARDGNLGEVSIDNHGSNVTAWSADSSVYTTGVSSYKATTNTNSGNRYIQKYFNSQLISGNYYIMLLDLRRSSAGTVSPSVRDGTSFNSTGMTGSKSINVSLSANTWTTAILKWQQTTTENVNLVVDDLGADAINYWVDGVRIFQVTLTEYNLLTAGIADSATAAKYPYTDDIKHLNGLYAIRYGENLVPPAGEWTMHPQATINGPYNITLTATAASQGSYATIPALSNQTYTLSVPAVPSSGFYYAVQLRRADMTLISEPVDITSSSSSVSGTFTTTSDTAFIQVYVTNSATSGAYTFSNCRLNLGSTDKGFKMRNDDMMVFPVQLASSVDGSVYDQVFHRDGRYWRENRFQKDMILDGSLGWFYFGTNTGIKNVSFPLPTPPVNDIAYNTVTKFDGKTLVTKLDASWISSADCTRVTGGNLYVSTNSADTGWGDSYTPSTQEIQAYFYGWKMYCSDTNPAGDGVYNGTGNKRFCYRVDGVSATYTGSTSTSTAPTTPAPLFKPYKLTYQLATPTFDDLTEIMEGEINLLEGLNQIEIGAGMILKEKVSPQLSGTQALINSSNPSYSASQLKNRSNRIMRIDRNGRWDNGEWTLYANYVGSSNSYGGALGVSSSYSLLDTYEVTYLALDQYLLTSSPVIVSGEYDVNIKTIQDRTSQRVSDMTQRLSVAEMLAVRTYQKPDMSVKDTTYYVDATNGSDSNDGSSSRPFKTIKKAISLIPQIVNHMFNVYVAPGIYNEDVVLSGFVISSPTASVQLLGNQSAADTSRQVNSITISGCKGRLIAIGFYCVTTTTAGVIAQYSHGFIIDYMNVASAAGQDGISIVAGQGRVESCIVNGRNNAIIVGYYCNVYCYNNSGSGNTVGYASTVSSYLGYVGTTPSATTSMSATSGSSIVPNSGVINPWGDNTYANRSSALCWSSAGLTLTSSATWYKMPVNNKSIDQLGEYDTTLYRFTAKHSGLYLVSGSAEITNLVSGDRVYLAMYKSGLQVSFLGDIQYSNYVSHIVSGTDQVVLNAGEYIELFLFSLVSGGKSLGNNSNTNWLRVTQIG